MDEQEYILGYLDTLLKKDPLTLYKGVLKSVTWELPTFSWILPNFYMGGIYMSDKSTRYWFPQD